MGSSKSKEMKVDSQGQVNTNIVIDDTVNVHNQELLIILYIICAIKLIEFVMNIARRYGKCMKKRYAPPAIVQITDQEREINQSPKYWKKEKKLNYTFRKKNSYEIILQRANKGRRRVSIIQPWDKAVEHSVAKGFMLHPSQAANNASSA